MIDIQALDDRASSHIRIGFSRLGYEMREIAWDNSELGDIAGKTVLITGANDGLGRATAQRLALLGGHVVLIGRNADKLARAAAEITDQTGNDAVEIVICDLSSLSSVRSAAAEILERFPSIHVLINNAGVMLHERIETGDGFEATWATNILGPYLLTELLMDRILASAPARVIEVSSGGMLSQKIDVDDSQTAHQPYDGSVVYSRTKRAQVIVTEERAKRFGDADVVFHSLHPGWASTTGVANNMKEFAAKYGDILRSPMQGADTTVWLATASEPTQSNGLFWHDRRPRETYRDEVTKETPQERSRLLALLHEQAGLAPIE